MRRRWSSDAAYGMLAIAAGMLLNGIALLGGWLFLTQYGLGIAALGTALTAFGGWEYFASRD